jgi:subtilisin
MIGVNSLKQKLFLFIGVLILLSSFAWAETTVPPRSQGPERVYIDIADPDQREEIQGRADVLVRHEFRTGVFSAEVPSQVRERLEKKPGVTISRVPLFRVTKPPGGCDPWPECKNGGDGTDSRTSSPDDQTPYGIEQVYNDSTLVATSGGAGVDVAILDTGVYKDHLDLERRVEQCKDFTAGGPFQVKVKDGSCSDKHGHGTHVAGTVLADGGSDGKGIYGVAPEADLFAYKVCGNDGSCWGDDIAKGIEVAADRGAEIISMSLGGDIPDGQIQAAVDYAVAMGLLVVAAAGNDGPDLESIDYPGAYPNVVAVAAIDAANRVADFSSRGLDDGNDASVTEKEVEFATAGVSVESTWNDGGYRYLSGTSMATPHVTGLAAKLWQGSGSATRDHLRTHIIDIALGLYAEPGFDPASGYGLPVVG